MWEGSSDVGLSRVSNSSHSRLIGRRSNSFNGNPPQPGVCACVRYMALSTVTNNNVGILDNVLPIPDLVWLQKGRIWNCPVTWFAWGNDLEWRLAYLTTYGSIYSYNTDWVSLTIQRLQKHLELPLNITWVASVIHDSLTVFECIRLKMLIFE
jgi:hypothetical protein